MKDIILDTNAYRYLYDIINGKVPTINVEGKFISNDKFVSTCSDCSKLYITGETLFELFWQSIEVDNTVNDFIDKYSFMRIFEQEYGVPVRVLNNTAGLFEMDKFVAECQEGKVEWKYYVQKKKEYEVTTLKLLISIMYGAMMLPVADYFQVEINDIYYQSMVEMISTRLADIANQYYVQRSIVKNEMFSQEIDKILLSAWKSTINFFPLISTNWNDKIFNVRASVNSGVEYMHLLYNKIRKCDNFFMQRFENCMSELCNELCSKREYRVEQIEYIKFICRGCAYSGSKLRKNDAIDYSIITCLAMAGLINNTKEVFDAHNTCMITFDKKLYSFAREHNVLYDKEVYNSLMV